MACMKVIASVIPTVRSFAGRGDMREDQEALKPDTRRLLEDLENRVRSYNNT